MGFRSGTSRWRPLWLWARGYLRKDGPAFFYNYGSPCVYLVLTDKGRAVGESTARFLKNWNTP